MHYIFDVPFVDISGHKVFFRPNEGGSVLVGANYVGDPNVADSNGRIRGDKFFQDIRLKRSYYPHYKSGCYC